MSCNQKLTLRILHRLEHKFLAAKRRNRRVKIICFACFGSEINRGSDSGITLPV